MLVLQPSLSHSDYVKLEGECWRSSVDANVLVRSHARPQSELITDLPAPHVRSPVALTYTARGEKTEAPCTSLYVFYAFPYSLSYVAFSSRYLAMQYTSLFPRLKHLVLL